MEPILGCNDSYNHQGIAYGLASKQIKMVVYKSVEWAFTQAWLWSDVTQMTLMPQRWRALMSVSDYKIPPLDFQLFSPSMQHFQKHSNVASFLCKTITQWQFIQLLMISWRMTWSLNLSFKMLCCNLWDFCKSQKSVFWASAQ